MCKDIFSDVTNGFSGYERLYDDDDSEREAIVHIGKRGRIFRTFNGL